MTAISWTDVTWNPTVGCARVSEGCRNCYAEHAAAMVNRTQGERSAYLDVLKIVDGDPRWAGVAKFLPERLTIPLRWRKPRRVFVDSMSDLFHDDVTNEQIAAVFGVMAATTRHTYQVLTKRPERMRDWFAWVATAAMRDGEAGGPVRACVDAGIWESPPIGEHGDEFDAQFSAGPTQPWPLPNVWLGVSVEDQAAADERIPLLLQTRAAVRFLSCEPLLGPLSLLAQCPPYYAPHLRSDRISWVIAGCESGAGARPAEAAWLRSLRDQCAAAGVTFFLKQATAADAIRTGPGSHSKPGGVIELPYLDGVQHAAFPVTP